MPVIVSFLIPFIVAAILIIFFKKKVTLVEWLTLIGSSVLFTLMVYGISKSISQTDTEYLGGYVMEIKYYEPWNERVRKSREVPCGTDKDGHTTYCTEYYWVTEEHSEQWTMTTTLDKYEQRLKKENFNSFKSRFNTTPQFIDMHRHYYTKDGDAYSWKWNGRRETLIPVTKEHIYKNPLKNSHSIFRYDDLDADSAKALGLYEYPKINLYNQSPVLGCKVDMKTWNQLNYINAIYGAKYQFRLYILVYPAEKGLIISEMQKGYWHGGNKNEFIVCLGANDRRKIEWVNAFSWQDAPWLDVETRSWFEKNDTLDLYSYGQWLEKNIPSKWKRKEFGDFDYLSSELSDTAKWIIFILTCIFCVVYSIIAVNNDIERVPKGNRPDKTDFESPFTHFYKR